jgi:hypothetical protein
MRTTPPVFSFISFTSFNYKRATQYSGVPTTGSLYREEEDTLSVAKTPKPLNSLLCTAKSLFFLMKQYSFKNTEQSIKNNISKICQVADHLLKHISDRYFFLSVFNYVVFIDFYERSFC